MSKYKNIFFELKGSWSFLRRINGLEAMTGKASFSLLTEQSNCYWYYEEGTLINLNQTFYREYIYCLEKSGIKVYLAREKKRMGLLYALQYISDHQATGEHLCNQDVYRAFYTFQKEGAFTLEVKVNGPQKDDFIKTDFRKKA